MKMKRKSKTHHNERENVEAWIARGRVEGAAWALQEIEKRMG